VRPIPLVDVKAQYEPLLPRIREAIDGVLATADFILGPNVAAFEQEAAGYLGVREAIGVANGTDALVLVLDALAVGPGDEVICPSFTFYATAEAIARRGATPVFADVDAATMNLDPEDVAARVTPRTKAIIAVHLFGRPAPTAELAQLGVPVIEDAAQAFGSPEIGRTGIASTSASIRRRTCSRSATAASSRPTTGAGRARAHAALPRLARQGRLRARRLQLAARRAAGGRPARSFSPSSTRGSRCAARRRRATPSSVSGGVRAARGRARARLPPVRLPLAERDRIRAALKEAGIGSAVYYTTPLHLQPALAYLGYSAGSLP
jgi:dTDP-4-amino-4,6-dideoxygalactose transaminase